MTAKTLAKDSPVARARGSHATRSAQMRQRLIDSAIACLSRLGYAATTTQVVMEEAGVSRGAMLHHFPTKVDLIIAVAEAAALHQNRFVRRRLGEIPPGLDRYMALTRATWEAICQPPALALLEIMLASRSDAALGERFPLIAQQLEAEQREGVWDLARELGIRDREAVESMVRLHVAAMRGLLIEMTFTGDRETAENDMALLDFHKRTLTGALLTGSSIRTSSGGPTE